MREERRRPVSEATAEPWIVRVCRLRHMVQATLLTVPLAFLLWACALIVREESARRDDGPGPVRIGEEELAEQSGETVPGNVSVEIACSGAREAPFAYASPSVHSRLWIVPLRGRALLVAGATRPEGLVQGALEPTPAWVRARVPPSDREGLFDVVLVEREPIVGSIVCAIAVPGGLAVLAAALLLRAVRYVVHPERHRAIRRLVAGGWFAPGAPDIGDEVAAPDAWRFRGWILTRNFVVRAGPLRFDVRAWHDLVWAYLRISREYSHLIVPVGSRHEPVLWFAPGVSIELRPVLPFDGPRGREDAGQVLEHAFSSAPWAERGFDESVRKRLRTDARTFCSEIAARRDARPRDA